MAYAAGQILPTSVGGDAVRIYETARRHPGHGDTGAATVLLERAIGGAATLVLAAVGFLLAVGHYDVGAYLWIEAFFVVATIVLGFLLFSRRARPLLKLGRPVLAWVRLDKLVARVYHAIHSYRDHVGVLFAVFVITLGVQSVRVLAVWLSGKAVGIDLSPRPYYVMGPLLFLVMLSRSRSTGSPCASRSSSASSGSSASAPTRRSPPDSSSSCSRSCWRLRAR